MTLRERQKRMLEFVHHHVTTHGFSPTIREIGSALDILSTSMVNYHLERLIRAGYLIKSATKSRTIRLTAMGISIINPSFSASSIEVNPYPEKDVKQLEEENARLRSENEKLGQELRDNKQRFQRELHQLRQRVSV